MKNKEEAYKILEDLKKIMEQMKDSKDYVRYDKFMSLMAYHDSISYLESAIEKLEEGLDY